MLISNFSSSSNPKLKAKFDRFGCVYVCGKNSVASTLPIRDPDIYNLLMWYLDKIRPPMLSRALKTKKAKKNNGKTKINDKMVPLEDVLFISERGNGISGNTFRDALDAVQLLTGLPFHFTPHDLRHTGCTQMMEVYQAPHIAQQYMRHKNLATTFGYYHPDPVDAGSEVNKAMNIKLPSGQNDHET
jgi:integrase